MIVAIALRSFIIKNDLTNNVVNAQVFGKLRVKHNQIVILFMSFHKMKKMNDQ